MKKVLIPKNVIRPNHEGALCNYGPLALSSIDGVQFLGSYWELERLGITYKVAEQVPEFLTDFTLDIEHAQYQAPQGIPSPKRYIQLYPLKKEDLNRLGESLSRFLKTWVAVKHAGRWLKTWNTGMKVGKQYTLDHFFIGLTPQEIDRSRF